MAVVMLAGVAACGAEGAAGAAASAPGIPAPETVEIGSGNRVAGLRAGWPAERREVPADAAVTTRLRHVVEQRLARSAPE